MSKFDDISFLRGTTFQYAFAYIHRRMVGGDLLLVGKPSNPKGLYRICGRCFVEVDLDFVRGIKKPDDYVVAAYQLPQLISGVSHKDIYMVESGDLEFLERYLLALSLSNV